MFSPVENSSKSLSQTGDMQESKISNTPKNETFGFL